MSKTSLFRGEFALSAFAGARSAKQEDHSQKLLSHCVTIRVNGGLRAMRLGNFIDRICEPGVVFHFTSVTGWHETVNTASFAWIAELGVMAW